MYPVPVLNLYISSIPNKTKNCNIGRPEADSEYVQKYKLKKRKEKKGTA